MKKIVFILIMIFLGSKALAANAGNVTREEFAGMLSPVICNSIAEEDIAIKDVESPSDEILKAVSTGAMSLDGDGCFNPQEEMQEYDLIKSLVTVWEIRMGNIEAPALGGYLSGYSAFIESEKKVIDKAVMIGIAPESGVLNKNGGVSKDAASLYVKKLMDAIDIMKNHGVSEVITSFRNDEEITGVPANTTRFFATLNAPASYKEASLIVALYSDGRLTDVAHKSYKNLETSDFTIMHQTLEIPETEGNIRVKAFIFDGVNSLKPIYEYKLLR